MILGSPFIVMYLLTSSEPAIANKIIFLSADYSYENVEILYKFSQFSVKILCKQFIISFFAIYLLSYFTNNNAVSLSIIFNTL